MSILRGERLRRLGEGRDVQGTTTLELPTGAQLVSANSHTVLGCKASL